jgi:hypothetical protein
MEAAMKRKLPKKSAKKNLKLRKKPLRDLPVKGQAATAKGGMQTTFAPPYVPVGPVVGTNPQAGPQKTFAPPYVPVGPVVGKE